MDTQVVHHHDPINNFQQGLICDWLIRLLQRSPQQQAVITMASFNFRLKRNKQERKEKVDKTCRNQREEVFYSVVCDYFSTHLLWISGITLTFLKLLTSTQASQGLIRILPNMFLAVNRKIVHSRNPGNNELKLHQQRKTTWHQSAENSSQINVLIASDAGLVSTIPNQ